LSVERFVLFDRVTLVGWFGPFAPVDIVEVFGFASEQVFAVVVGFVMVLVVVMADRLPNHIA